jgi:hypothetical protein
MFKSKTVDIFHPIKRFSNYYRKAKLHFEFHGFSLGILALRDHNHNLKHYKKKQKLKCLLDFMDIF